MFNLVFQNILNNARVKFRFQYKFGRKSDGIYSTKWSKITSVIDIVFCRLIPKYKCSLKCFYLCLNESLTSNHD